MKIDSKHYSIGTSGNQQRNCSTELMQTLHLIPKYSPLCCYCHCFELTCVCHHPSHSQRIDENPLSSDNVYLQVKCVLKLRNTIQHKERKAWQLHEPHSLNSKHFRSHSPLLTSHSPPNPYCSADYRRAYSHPSCQLHVHRTSVLFSCCVSCHSYHHTSIIFATGHYGSHHPAWQDLHIHVHI